MKGLADCDEDSMKGPPQLLGKAFTSHGGPRFRNGWCDAQYGWRIPKRLPMLPGVQAAFPSAEAASDSPRVGLRPLPNTIPLPRSTGAAAPSSVEKQPRPTSMPTTSTSPQKRVAVQPRLSPWSNRSRSDKDRRRDCTCPRGPGLSDKPWSMVTYACTAFLGLLVFGLGLNVSLNRLKRKEKSREDLKNPESALFRARIAHSNACQYAAMLAILMLLNQGSLAGVFSITAVVSRYLHALGFLGFKKAPNPFIFAGASGTYLSGLALSLILLYHHLPI